MVLPAIGVLDKKVKQGINSAGKKITKGMKGKGYEIAKAEKVYLIVSKDKTEKDYAVHKKYFTSIQKKLKAAKIETELVELDRHNIEEITRVARDLILKEADNEIAINLASGSKNHAIGLDRACMTFRKRDNIHPFYAKPKKYVGVKYPCQQSSGLDPKHPITQVPIHRIIVPDPELIEALRIIRSNGEIIKRSGFAEIGKKGIKKKDLAKLIFGSGDKTNMVRLQRNITEKLDQVWQAIEIISIGRSDWISLTDEGKYLRFVLRNEETY